VEEGRDDGGPDAADVNRHFMAKKVQERMLVYGQ
jgi:hypothetical protein